MLCTCPALSFFRSLFTGLVSPIAIKHAPRRGDLVSGKQTLACRGNSLHLPARHCRLKG
jgi:hypothetical protein